MTNLRFTLAQLMAIMLYLGFGFAARRNADDYWASATFTVAIISISAALVGAIARKGRARMTWAGFAVFGWAYVVTGLLAPRMVRTPFGGKNYGMPALLTEWAFDR